MISFDVAFALLVGVGLIAMIAGVACLASRQAARDPMPLYPDELDEDSRDRL